MSTPEAVTQLHYEYERFMAQYQFCRWLLDRDPPLETTWGNRLQNTADRVLGFFDSGDLEKVRTEVRSAEQDLSGLGETAKTFTIYCIGHAHIDMNWMWSWPETVAVTIDSVTTILRLFEEFPGFTLSQSQASIYRILEENRPDLLEKVKRYVTEGRWEVTANHWVESDKNLVTGEALARHLLYTRAYMSSLFGLAPEDTPIDWAPDTFGHAHTVPDYLVRGGVRFVYLHRPGSDGGPLKPDLFRWRGAGGSDVIVHNDMYYGYNGSIGPHVATRVLTERVEATGLPYSLYVYGVGDHGGGPTRADLTHALDMQQWPLFPTIKFSTARKYFERVESDRAGLPVLDKELNYEFTGCYTTQTLIKRANRYGEQRLLAAEFSSAMASQLRRMSYPGSMFEEQWRNHLFNHFHDILPGSGVHDTRTYSHGLYQNIVAAAGSAETQALRAIAELIDTEDRKMPERSTTADQIQIGADAPRVMGAGAGYGAGEGAPSFYTYAQSDRSQAVVVFNSLQDPREETVEAVIWDQGNAWRAGSELDLFGSEAPAGYSGSTQTFTVEGPDSEVRDAQVLAGGSYWGHEYRRIVFPVSVPGLGYARYLVRPGTSDARSRRAKIPSAKAYSRTTLKSPSMHLGIRQVCGYASHERSPEGLENEHLRLELDPISGGIRRLVNKEVNHVVIDQPSAAALLSYCVERPRPMSAWQINHLSRVEQPELIALRRSEDGTYSASLVAEYRICESTFMLTYRVVNGDPVLYIEIDGTWFERGGPEIGTPVLRLVVPTTMQERPPRYDIPFGSIERDVPHGEEVPALSWAAVSGHPGGLALLNDSKHGHSFSDGTLTLTLIRSSYQPDPLPEIGKHSIRCGLLPFRDEPNPSVISRRAAEFNRPLVVLNTDTHEGLFGTSGELMTVSSDHAVLSCVKQAEKAPGLVVRLFNPTEKATTAEIETSSSLGSIVAAQFLDLNEDTMQDGKISTTNGRVTLKIEPRGIKTVLLTI